MLRDAAEILCAGELIRLGARLPLLESVTALSRRKLTRLYKQVAGTPPSTGQLPYSADWFINWQHNLHATAFYHVWVGVQPQKRHLQPLVYSVPTDYIWKTARPDAYLR